MKIFSVLSLNSPAQFLFSLGGDHGTTSERTTTSRSHYVIHTPPLGAACTVLTSRTTFPNVPCAARDALSSARGQQLLQRCSNFSDLVLDSAPELELTPPWRRLTEFSSIPCARRARKYTTPNRLQFLTSGAPKPRTPLPGNLKIKTLAPKGPNLQDPKPPSPSAYILTSRVS